MTQEAEALTEVSRVVERLRSMPLGRLDAVAPSARALAQRLADRAAVLGGWPAREVPDVGAAAVGDQVAVTAADLLALPLSPADLAEIAADLRGFRLSL